jgi:hypothetical protein
MICRYCGTELPDDAQFCGECGRAVVVESLVGVGSVGDATGSQDTPFALFGPAGSSSGDPATSTPSASDDDRAEAADDLLCPQCGTAVDQSDIFCGECGFVLTVAPSAESEPGRPAEPPVSEPASPPQKDPNVDNENETDVVAPVVQRARTIPDPFPWGADIGGGDDVEATRIVTQNGTGDRFVLQFSTGESVTVSGAGLIGRNPSAQPGEYVDQLVSIFDVGKSVSKTHLEFGQEGGRFWVSDRYSTNGSIVRQPEADPRRCEPGSRYFVVRGTRIDIGEQFFVVS